MMITLLILGPITCLGNNNDYYEYCSCYCCSNISSTTAAAENDSTICLLTLTVYTQD